ncbi:MAG: baseplate J/gp47 family protein [Bryobacterales bacterium]|nr:baseplate J/gp47 family protein [Bryobacterales bacterium]
MSYPKYDAAGCGCCRKTGEFPLEIYNRPALSGIDYRIGDYGLCRENLLAAISRTQLLKSLHSRDNLDYGIAIFDLWAYLADILTFYQERIANEAFLRTATLRESVLRLAALIDYRLGRGSAATAYLAFTLDKNKSLVLPAGLRVQSVPGQNRKPQKFETIEELSADARYNRVAAYPLPSAFNPFAAGNGQAALPLAAAAALAKPLARGEKLLIVSPDSLERKQLTSVTREERQVSLAWDVPVQSAGLTPWSAKAVTYNRVFGAFGAGAPDSYMSVAASNAASGFTWTLKQRAAADYNLAVNATPPAAPEIPLGQKVDDIKAGTRVLLAAATAAGKVLTRFATVTSAEARSAAFAPLTGQVTHLRLGISTQGAPLVVGGPLDRIFVFAIADDGAVWMRATSSARKFMDWQSLGGQVTAIAAARDGASRWRLFASGKDGAVWTIRQTPTGTPDAWQSLGGVGGLLAAAVHPSGLFTLVTRASDGSVRVIRETQAGVWGGWENIGGTVSGLAAGFGADGTFYAFGIGKDHAVWYNRRLSSGVWQGWVSLGGWVDLLAVERNQDGRLAVFARGLDQGLWLLNQTNTGWGAWTGLGGGLDQLAVTTWLGRIVALVRGAGKALFYRVQTAVNGTAYLGWSVPFGAAYPLDAFSAGNLVSGIPLAAMRTPEGAVCVATVAPAARYDLEYPIWKAADRRSLAVYELTRDPLAFREERFAGTITGNRISVALDALPPVETGRRVILDDAREQPHLAEVLSATTTGDSLVITFTPALTRALESETAVLCANVAKATHGETVKNEVLGSGDASQRFLSFALKKHPVTYVPAAGQPNGVANTLELRVGGILWEEVSSLLGRTSSERVYSTRVDDEGKMTVQFGGSPGARVPTGRNNIVATYRQGLGEDGNVSARSLTTLLDRPAGLKAATNPAPAEGGASPETLEQARSNAPSTVQTFGRIVSVRDFEHAARELAMVAKARAYVDWDGEEQAVFVVVAGPGGTSLANSVKDIAASLDALRDTNRKMNIVPHASRPVELALDVIAGSAYTLDAVQAAVEEAIEELFSFDNRELGQPVYLSDLYRALQALDGVVAVDLDVLRPKGAAGVSRMADVYVPLSAIATLDLNDATISVAHGGF